MRILLTNDDGVDAPGLAALERACATVGEVWTVAPQYEMSACSRAISLRRPLRIQPRGERRWCVDGTPTDAVYAALTHLLPVKPDLLVAGVNPGPNMAEDVLYSGTVAAALEALMHGVPSMAVSLNTYVDPPFDAAARYVVRLMRELWPDGWNGGAALNVNLPPDVDPERTPWTVAPLGARRYGQGMVERRDPRGVAYYWIGGDPLGMADVPGSDLNTVRDGAVAVTPLRPRYFDDEAARELSRFNGSAAGKGQR